MAIRVDGEDATLLHWVTCCPSLPVPVTCCPKTVSEHLQSSEPAEAVNHTKALVGCAVWVREERYISGMVLGEVPECLDRAVADDCERISRIVDQLSGVGVVSSLLTTEQSAKVANEDENCWLIGPQ